MDLKEIHTVSQRKISGKFLTRFFIPAALTVTVGSAVFLLWPAENTVHIVSEGGLAAVEGAIAGRDQAENPTDTDIEPQQPLSSPPAEVRGIYLTSWSAGNERRITDTLELAKEGRLNAVVLDVKDYSGYVAYGSQLPAVLRYRAKEVRIGRLNALIRRLHDAGIYVIARITVFQDPILAAARPDIAVHSRKRLTDQRGSMPMVDADLRGTLTSATLWKDRKGLAWVDPASREAWDYTVDIAKEVASRGVDELNFDYIRFPSDGNLSDMMFPIWEGKGSRREVIKNFFAYLRQSLPEAKVSADVFGMTLIAADDMGIGQMIEDAYAYFDYVCPMVYPSHFAAGFAGYKNPAAHPYAVIKYSMEAAVRRLTTSFSSSSVVGRLSSVKLRPWLQAFDLGARYDNAMIQAQIRGTYDAATSTPEVINGYLLWNPENRYNKGLFEPL